MMLFFSLVLFGRLLLPAPRYSFLFLAYSPSISLHKTLLRRPPLAHRAVVHKAVSPLVARLAPSLSSLQFPSSLLVSLALPSCSSWSFTGTRVRRTSLGSQRKADFAAVGSRLSLNPTLRVIHCSRFGRGNRGRCYRRFLLCRALVQMYRSFTVGVRHCAFPPVVSSSLTPGWTVKKTPRPEHSGRLSPVFYVQLSYDKTKSVGRDTHPPTLLIS